MRGRAREFHLVTRKRTVSLLLRATSIALRG